MADNAILFKYSAKSIGMKFGIIPSFMAKPWGNVRNETFLPFAPSKHKFVLHSFLVVVGKRVNNYPHRRFSNMFIATFTFLCVIRVGKAYLR